MESDLIKAAALLDEATIRDIMLKESPPTDENICMMGILNIYYIVYANYVLAAGTGFTTEKANHIRDHVKGRSATILDFFESTYPIKKAFRDSGFLQWGSWTAEAPENIEDYFESPEEVLLKAGFRKIDLDLWTACLCFDLVEIRVLLACGADPDVHIPFALSEKDLPLAENYREIYETNCASWHASGYSSDFFDCYNGFEYWECSAGQKDIDIPDSYLPALIQAAANQIIYNYLRPHSA